MRPTLYCEHGYDLVLTWKTWVIHGWSQWIDAAKTGNVFSMGFSIWDCKMSLNHCENGETKGVRTCFVLKSVPLTCSIFARFPMSGGFTI